MKILLSLTLLVTGLISNVFVFGQVGKPDSLHFSRPEFRQTLPGYIRPPMVSKISTVKPYKITLHTDVVDSIRTMAPDRMPCLVTNLLRMERMPVKVLPVPRKVEKMEPK
jgi:hypothetical protein